MAKSKKWVYGQSPNPSTWSEAVNILKSSQKPKKKSNGLMDKLNAIEKKLKDK